MIKLLEKIKTKFIEFAKAALAFLCIGVIVQLILGEKLLGWDPVGNIQDGGSAFIGVLVLVLLYQLYLDRKND